MAKLTDFSICLADVWHKRLLPSVNAFSYRVFYLCFDISYFLFQLLATNLDEEEYQVKAEGFLKGYETVTEISNEEKKFLPYACLAIMTYYISVQCDRFEFWTNIFLNEDHLKRMVGNLKRWIAYNKIEMV